MRYCCTYAQCTLHKINNFQWHCICAAWSLSIIFIYAITCKIIYLSLVNAEYFNEICWPLAIWQCIIYYSKCTLYILYIIQHITIYSLFEYLIHFIQYLNIIECQAFKINLVYMRRNALISFYKFSWIVHNHWLRWKKTQIITACICWTILFARLVSAFVRKITKS